MSEPVFHYRGPTDIEKVITAEDTKVFSAVGTCRRLGPGEKVRIQNPVPVYSGSSEDDDLLGFAVVYEENGSLIAELNLNYGTPERLSIESGAKYYAHALIDHVQHRLISIGLDERVFDKDILPVREQS